MALRRKECAPRAPAGHCGALTNAEVVQMLTTGQTIKQIAEAAGIGVRCVSSHIRRHRLAPPSRKAPVEINPEKIEILAKSGLNVEEIALRLGASVSGARHAARRHGIKIARKRRLDWG